MIKKFLSMVAIAGMVFSTSCSSDEFGQPATDGESIVSFTAELPAALQSRAFGDGTTATSLSYFVYGEDADRNWVPLPELSSKQDVEMEGLTAKVNLSLVNGEKYNVVFWADAPGADSPYTVNPATGTVTVNYTNAAANDENRDAFYKVESFVVEGNMTRDVELKRPFAQINIGTSDWADVLKNTNVEIKKTGVEVNAYTTLNFKNGDATNKVPVTFELADMPVCKVVDQNAEEEFPVDGYKYLAMNYILVDEKEVVDVTINYDGGVESRTFTAVPVQRNYRTNIYGKLITSDEQFDVEIVPDFEGGFNDENGPKTPIVEGVAYDEMTNTYYLSGTEGLVWYSNESRNPSSAYLKNNPTVKLTEDVDLAGIEWTPIAGISGSTFDGGDKTISNLTVTGDAKSVGLFASTGSGMYIQNVKMKNVNITGTDYVGAIVGTGMCARIENCHVDGGTITANVKDKDGGAKAGGIVGYLTAQNNAHAINCSVKNLKVVAYRDVAGAIGMAQGARCIVKGVTVENTTVFADKLQGYKDTNAATNAGEVVGRNESAQISETSATNVTVVVCEINAEKVASAVSSKGVNYAIANGATVVNLYDGEYTDIINVRGGRTCTIQGLGDGAVLAGLDHQSNGNPSTITVKNVTINNAICEKGWFIGTSQNMAPCVGLWDGNITFDNCDFIVAGTSGKETGVMTWWTTAPASKLTFNGCTFVGENDHAQARAMQIYGNVNLTVNNCVFNTKKDYTLKYVGNEGNEAVFNGNTVNNSENFVELGSSAYPGENYTVRINNTTYGTGVSPYVVANEEGQTVYIDGDQEHPAVEAFIGTTGYTTLAAAFSAAQDGDEIKVKAGTYNVDNCAGKKVTISAYNNSKVVFEIVGSGQGEGNGQLDYGFDNSTVTFKNITFKTNNQTYAGYARLVATYINCTFDNCYCLNSTSEFDNCVFNVSGDQYNLWTWGAPTAKFNRCVFNSDGKAVLLYGTANTKLTIENSTFNDKGGLTDKKAAIEIGNDYNKSYELVVNNTVVNGYEINDKGINTGTTLWANKNSMGKDKLNVVVDGVDVY